MILAEPQGFIKRLIKDTLGFNFIKFDNKISDKKSILIIDEVDVFFN
jgi:hypothetical protein